MIDLNFWRSHARSYGTWPTLKCLGHRASNRVIPHATLVCIYITLDRADKQFLNVPPGFEARFLGADELQPLSRMKEAEISENFLRDFSKKGDQCYAILEGSNVAALGWYSRLPTAINEELTLHFDPEYVYMYFGYTFPKYRGRRLHAVGMTRALLEYVQSGCKGMVSFVESDNLASLRSCMRMGYKEIGRIFTAKVAGRYWIRADKQCEELHLRVVPVAA